MALRRYSFGGT